MWKVAGGSGSSDRLLYSQYEYIHSAHSWTCRAGGRLAGCGEDRRPRLAHGSGGRRMAPVRVMRKGGDVPFAGIAASRWSDHPEESDRGEDTRKGAVSLSAAMFRRRDCRLPSRTSVSLRRHPRGGHDSLLAAHIAWETCSVGALPPGHHVLAHRPIELVGELHRRCRLAAASVFNSHRGGVCVMVRSISGSPSP